MSKYTTEENKELVDTIKGPRFYRISIGGYGGEAEYIKLTKAQYEFWNNHIEEHGDMDVVNYCVSAEDRDFDFEDLEELPEEMEFLYNKEDDYSSPWYEAPTSISHQWGCDFNNAPPSIDEVDSDDYNASNVKEIVYNEDLSEYCETNDVDIKMDVEQVEDADYVLQFWSAEKGGFFDGVIETVGPFDPKKLKITTYEYPNGDDTLGTIEYDGVEVDNGGGDTNGKGYSVHIWSNV